MRRYEFGTKLTGVAMTVALATSPAMAAASDREPERMLLAAATKEAQELRLKAQHLVDRAKLTATSFAAGKQTDKLQKYLGAAAGVVIIPKLVSGGIGIGGEGGVGLAMSRDKTTGNWSEPAFVDFGGLSLGPQLGVETAEMVAVIMTEETLYRVIQGEVGVGADAKAIAGSNAARAAAVGTAERGDIHVFARSEGAFLGAAVKGGFINPKEDWNQAYYARPVSPTYILTHRDKVMNHGAIGLMSEMRRLTSGGQKAERPTK